MSNLIHLLQVNSRNDKILIEMGKDSLSPNHKWTIDDEMAHHIIGIMQPYSLFNNIVYRCYITNDEKFKTILSGFEIPILKDNHIEENRRYVLLQERSIRPFKGEKTTPIITILCDRKTGYVIRRIGEETENGTIREIFTVGKKDPELHPNTYNQYFYKNKVLLDEETRKSLDKILEIFQRTNYIEAKDMAIQDEIHLQNEFNDLLTYDPLDKGKHIYDDFIKNEVYKEDGMAVEKSDVEKALKVFEKDGYESYKKFRDTVKEKYREEEKGIER